VGREERRRRKRCDFNEGDASDLDSHGGTSAEQASGSRAARTPAGTGVGLSVRAERKHAPRDATVVAMPGAVPFHPGGSHSFAVAVTGGERSALTTTPRTVSAAVATA
jgi:hypothetical protein